MEAQKEILEARIALVAVERALAGEQKLLPSEGFPEKEKRMEEMVEAEKEHLAKIESLKGELEKVKGETEAKVKEIIDRMNYSRKRELEAKEAELRKAKRRIVELEGLLGERPHAAAATASPPPHPSRPREIRGGKRNQEVTW